MKRDFSFVGVSSYTNRKELEAFITYLVTDGISDKLLDINGKVIVSETSTTYLGADVLSRGEHRCFKLSIILETDTEDINRYELEIDTLQDLKEELDSWLHYFTINELVEPSNLERIYGWLGKEQ